jgi:AraC-like DNA-binding protein
LRHNRVFESLDLDYTRDRISDILQPHKLRPQGVCKPTNCYLDHIPLNQTGVGAIRFGDMQVHVPEIADYHLFILCMSGHASATVERENYFIDRAHGLLMAPGEQMLASFSEDCEQLFVRISQKTVADHTGFRKLQFQRNVDLGNPLLAPWIHHLATIISDRQTSDFIRSVPQIAIEYERLLLSLLLAGQKHHDAAERACGVAPGSVKRAEEFIHSYASEPLSLADIASAAGVPARTLLESFRRFRGTSPIRYLRDVRLDNARKVLRLGRVATAAEAAMESGLMHLGRFSQEYAERFGERPSETLRTHRRP